MTKKSDVYSLAGINIANNFLTAALELIIPIYLIQKQFSLESIGFVLAILPFVFMFVRLILSVVGDIINTRTVFVINGIFGIIAPFIFLISTTPFGFGVARVAQGVSTSGFWAVVRTQIYRVAKKGNEEQFASLMLSVRSAGSLLGRVFVVSMGLFALSFDSAFLILGAVGGIIILLAYVLSDGKPLQKKISLAKAVKRYTKPQYWTTPTLIMICASIPDAPLFGYLIPVFLSVMRGIQLIEMGSLLILFSLGYILTVQSCKRLKLSDESIYLIAISCSALSLLAFPLVPMPYLPFIMFLCAVGLGAGGVIFEEVVFHTIDNDGWVSLDIGMIHVPYRFAEFIGLGVAGFIVVAFGFQVAFALCALFMALFILISRGYILSHKVQFRHGTRH